MKKVNNIFIFYILIQICNGLSCLDMQDQDSTNNRFNVGPHIFTRKGQFQLEELLLHIQFDKGSFTALENRLAYGFTRTFGMELGVIWVLQNSQKGKRTSGLGDIYLETQWHFYTQPKNLGNINAGIYFPTNSSQGPFFGTYGWVFELEGVHSSDDWHASSSWRVRINQRHKKRAPGTRFSYELIAGPKLHLKNGAELYTLYDLYLLYDTKAKEFGKTMFNTGGTIALLGPLISYKKENLLIEGSLQLPIAQRIPNIGPKVVWVSFLNIEMTF
jgi:hypothetical protein